MSTPANIGESPNYLARLYALVLTSLAQLVRPPTHARRAAAARRLAQHALLMTAIVGAVIVALMVGFDAWEIGAMPPRGTANLRPVRILTDFGKDTYVLWTLALMLALLRRPCEAARKPAS